MENEFDRALLYGRDFGPGPVMPGFSAWKTSSAGCYSYAGGGAKECRRHKMRAQLLANSVIAGHIGDSSRTPDRHAGNACELAGRASAGRSPRVFARVAKKVLTRCRRTLRLWDVGVDEGESCGRESVPRQEHSLFLFLRRPRPSSCIHS